MQLTDEQKKQVAAWVRGGAGLSEVQKRLASELGVSMTYMDVRFLLIDLDLKLKETPKEKPTPVLEKPRADDDGPGLLADGPGADEPAPGAGGVTVELDRLQKPGFLVSGTARFSDGVTATWGVDQFGRLALDAGRRGYKPSNEDIQAFQMQLQNLLARRGY